MTGFPFPFSLSLLRESPESRKAGKPDTQAIVALDITKYVRGRYRSHITVGNEKGNVVLGDVVWTHHSFVDGKAEDEVVARYIKTFNSTLIFMKIHQLHIPTDVRQVVTLLHVLTFDWLWMDQAEMD